LTEDESRVDILSNEEQARFVWLLDKIMAYISLETIQSFQIGRFNNQHRIALLGRFKSDDTNNNLLYIEKYDPLTRVARFSYFTSAKETPEIKLTCNGRSLKLTHKSSHWKSLVNQRYLGQHRFYVTLPKKGEVICKSAEKTLIIRNVKHNLTSPLSHISLSSFLQLKLMDNMTKSK